MSKQGLFKAVLGSLFGSVVAASVAMAAGCGDKKPAAKDPVALDAPVITLEENVISWEAVANADGYEVYKDGASVSFQTVTSYTIGETAVGTYTYTVKATSTSDDYTTSAASNSVTYTISSQPEAPVALAAPVITLEENVISWSAVEHADGYEVYEGDTKVSTQTGNSYTIDKTEAGSYTFSVKATSSDDGYTTSPASNTVTYTVEGEDEQPETPVEYAVTFKLSEDDQDPVVSNVESGNKVSEPTDPTKTGYDFEGWYDENDELFDFDTAVTKNITLTAKWSIHYYKVEFLLDDDTVFDRQHIAYQGNASEIATDPAKPGYIFDKWLDSENVVFDFENTEITEDTTLHASWTKKESYTYTVSFNTNGGAEIESQDIESGNTATQPADPVKENFVFAGWYSDEQLTKEYSFNTKVEKDITLYACWTLDNDADVEVITVDTSWKFGESAAADEENNVYALGTGFAIESGKEKEEDTFSGLYLDATTGKLSNSGRGDQYCQFNTGAKISFYTAKACEVTVEMYDVNYSVNGEAASTKTQTFVFHQNEYVVIEATGGTYIISLSVVYPAEDAEAITENTTWSFNSNDTKQEDNYFVFTSENNFNGTKGTAYGLTIDATTGKLSDNGGTWFQFNTGAKISFEAAKDCTVEVTMYQNSTAYTVNGTAGNSTHTYKLSAGTVTIASTANGYIGYIKVTFAEDDGNGTEVPEGYELIETNLDFAALADIYGDGVKLAQNETYGKFEFATGLYFEKSKNDVNTQGKTFYVTLSGEGNGNTISFSFDSTASSNDATTLKITDESNNEVYTFTKDKTAGLTTGKVALTNLPAGKYTIATSASYRISEFVVTEVLEKGVIASMEVNAPKVDFLVGDTFSYSGISATVTYNNGGTREQNNLVVDCSSVDTSKSGEYIVRVFYTENSETVTATYTVYVYAVESITYMTYTTNGNKQTTLKTVYVQGGTFSTDGLTIIAVAKCGDRQIEFSLTKDQYIVLDVDLTVVGEQTVTIKTVADENIKLTYSIYVLAAAQAEQGEIVISVNPAEEVSSTNFKTISSALSYLEQLSLDASVIKTINIADGVYNEKVFVNIPNVHFVGSQGTPNATTDNGVVIVYDAIAGKLEPSGSAYGTNGSATVSISATATGFVAENITFKNYYNTYELYNASLKISSNSQAVALLVEGDMAMFVNCKLTSYHDTLYANKGRQYYYNCWIEGHTDYIFGQDATVYFEGCNIYSIGSGASQANGGYVVALKPSSAASNYYFAFNGCTFDADDNTKAGSVALGRAWGADMKMVVVNSTISDKFSTTAHSAGTTSGQRYCTMSGNEPKAENMLEYGNSGAGAISESIANTCTYLTEEQAAAYTSANTVFANVTGYTATWQPEKAD